MNLASVRVFKLLQSTLVKNSIWGIVANILQTIFVSLFFVILARRYVSSDFANFLIASTIYQILVAFSSMGLGQWFIREFDLDRDKAGFTGKFIKIQAGLGVLFYIINIVIAFALYPSGQIRWLSIILGANIIFDNVIYGIKNLNIAEFKQKKTFIVLTIDGFLRLLLGGLLFFYSFSIITLSIFLIALRFLTLNLFMKVGSSNTMNLTGLLRATIVWEDLKKQIFLNWRFAVIGSISIVYWRLANVIISKMLTLQDVADYEISFRILSIAMILPTLASATIYSQFVKNYNAANRDTQRQLYKKLFLLYSFFAAVAYAFIYSFADILLPFAFGHQYAGAVSCIKQMFLTMLLFPTVLLQANLIVAMKQERIDMLLNLVSLLVNLAGCLIGLYYFRSLEVVNYSIFISFLIFHIFQNIFLIKKGITSVRFCISFYSLLFLIVAAYHYISNYYNLYACFFVFFTITCIIAVSTQLKTPRDKALTIYNP